MFPLLFPRLHEVTLNLPISSDAFDAGCYLNRGGEGRITISSCCGASHAHKS